MHYLFKKTLPAKVGSFQLFLSGYQDSTTFFQDSHFKLGEDSLGWTKEDQIQFKSGFERLVILDYLMRNTDRSSDNWMVKFDPESHLQRVHIAAIDNGLAFPTKHPNRIRSYPYGWLSMPIAAVPFSPQTGQELLPFLTSATWWEETIQGIEKIHRIDPDFKLAEFKKQCAVLRGQHYNLIDVLPQDGETPTSLYQRPLILVNLDEPTAFVKIKEHLQFLTRMALFKSC